MFIAFSRSEGEAQTHLLQSLVVDEAGGILRDLELPFLNLLSKLPDQAMKSAQVLLNRTQIVS